MGDTITSQIQDAIKTASVHVAIFSPRYAESSWCLDELHLMVESGKSIISVFYGVQPTELRRTHGEGVYAQALRNHENKRTSDCQPRYDSTTIENWRTALSTVAGMSGLELDKFNGDEGELLDEVVDSVSKNLRTNRLDVAEHPTGLDEKIKDFENNVLLVQRQQSDKAQVIGIDGMGGVGKTTLVKILFNTKKLHYKSYCFLSDVREKERKTSLESLQKELLEGLTRRDEKIRSVSEGIELLKTRLSSFKALVVLDDVDNVNQLDALLRPIRDVLHSNSLILITSRDRDVFTRSRVEESSIYRLTGLNPQHSQELFCLHAFTQPHPLPGFEGLVNKYLKACNRLPLSLKVFGALLYGNHDKSYWEDQLERLQQILPDEIQKSLQISYDALQMDEKQIFLDIACCFVWKERDTAITIWDGCGWKGSLVFRSLQNKNLVEVDSEMDHFVIINKIRMHDHLIDLGRKLAKDPGLPRRIFRVEDIADLSQQSSGVTEVRGICTYWKFPSFYDCKMRNLQLLHIDYTGKDDSLESLKNAVQSPNLIWLSLWNWDSLIGAYCFVDSDCDSDLDSFADSYTLPDSDSYLSSWIPLTKLRVLQVFDCLGGLWQEESQAPLQLRVLQISGHLFPKSIGLLKHLERVMIFGEIVIFRESFPEDICNLLSLKYLDIECGGRSLPDSLGNLTKLQHLELATSRQLERLPHSLGNLTNLKHINLSECEKLKQLPDTFGNLTNLQYINLSLCRELEQLPDTFENLTRLEFLDLLLCQKLKQLPDNFENLTGLKYFDLTGCDDLTMSTETLGNIVTLGFKSRLPSHLLEEFESDSEPVGIE